MEGGGAQTPLPDIVRALEKAGAQVQVFALSMRNGRALPTLEAAGITPIVRNGGEKDHLAALRWMVSKAREWQADVVWTSLTRATLLGQIAGRKLALPVVSWQHNAYLKPWNERLLRWRAGASSLWVADSDQVAELTVERLGRDRDDVITWPIFAADPGAPQASAWKPGQSVKIGSLGRLHTAKGYDVLIDALALLRQRKFSSPTPFAVEIGGTGALKQSLRQRAREKGVDQIDFVSFVSDPLEFLARQHLYVQPSRREGFCIAAHEAMQAGLPAIVTRTGEMPYTVNSSAIGRTVPVGDVSALTDAIEDLVSHPDRLAAMGQAARDRVLTRFSQETFDATAFHLVQRLKQLMSTTR